MFQFQYDYTLEDMNALSRVTGKTYRRKKVLIFRLVLALLGMGYLYMGCVLFAPGSKLVGVILLAAGILFVALSLFYHQGTAWRSKRMMPERMGSLTVELEETGLRGKSGAGEDFYPYSAVIGAYHYRERYFLFLDRRHAMLLPERALVRGEKAALGGFLSEKLKKEIKELR